MNTGHKILATFFGIGFFPLAPGTAASFMVVVLYKLFLYSLWWPLYILFFIILFFAGVFASTKYSSELGTEDPRRIVIDEACGQLFVLFRMPTSWIILLACFFLFRFFDIIKPYPIRRVEKLRKGWGIMMDDIAAAIYTALIIHIYLFIK